jgi:erythromycin esterase-like protein
MPSTAAHRPAARPAAARSVRCLAGAVALGAALAAAACASDPSAPRGAIGAGASEVAAVRQAARPVTGAPGDYDPIVALVGASTRLVFLGDATHGTHEFYAERARLTERLVRERGFTGVAVEADWAAAARVNAYVRGLGTDASAEAALGSFTEFPLWMWRNAEVRDLVRWLRAYNAGRPAAEQVGFYGLDVQDLFGSIDPVLRYLDTADPAAAARVRGLYACLAPYRPDVGRYINAAAAGGSCEASVRQAVTEVGRVAGARPADAVAAETRFVALRGAQAVADAEAYFRASYAGTTSSWNMRDSLMDRTLEATLEHLGAAAGRPSRVAVWAHNTHSGDARHTEMGAGGELNIGQLARQRHGPAALLTGFFTYTGSVYAASNWGEPGRVRTVNPALPGSYSALFHGTGVPSFALVLRGGGAAAEALDGQRLQRAIGVIYRPESERQSHYFAARLASQFDAVLFFDVTRAVTPLTGAAAAQARSVPGAAALDR